MKSYGIETKFTFGKFDGKTVRQVLDLQMSYINWCCINLEHFYISENRIKEIQVIKPEFEISEEGRQKLDKKCLIWELEQESKLNRANYKDQTDWSHYNDDLDMDQQSPDFWNQF